MSMAGLIDAAKRRPSAAFAAFLALHAAVWTALPSLLNRNLPLDVIEALTYGREWPLGHEKLPPLPWWLAEATWRVFGTDASLYALGQAAVIVAFVAVWMTARALVGSVGALVAILIIDGMHYFNVSAVKFNHNVVELPFWALAGFAFYAGLRRDKLRYWMLLGLALGLAWWAKYFAVILAAPLALFLLFDRDARRHLARPGPWIAAAVTLLVVAPNLYWHVAHGVKPFSYAEARAATPRGALDHLLRPLQFFAGQSLFLFPALVIALPLFWPRAAREQRAAKPDAFDRRIVALLAFGPAFTLFVFSLVSGRATNAMWGFPLWLFLGLWLVVLAPAALDRARLLRIGTLWAAVFVILAGAFCVDNLVLPCFDHRYRAAFFPGDRLSVAITRTLRAGDRPASPLTSSARCGTAAMSRTMPQQRPQPRVLRRQPPATIAWIDLARSAGPRRGAWCGPSATRTSCRQPMPRRRARRRGRHSRSISIAAMAQSHVGLGRSLGRQARKHLAAQPYAPVAPARLGH